MNLHIFLHWFLVLAVCYLALNFRLHLTLLHDVYKCVNKNEKKKKRWRFCVHYACLQWNKNKYRDHKYHHSGGEVPMKKRIFLKKVREFNRAPSDTRSARFAFLLVCASKRTNTHVCIDVRLRVCARNTHTNRWTWIHVCVLSLCRSNRIDFSYSHSPFTRFGHYVTIVCVY